MMDSSTVTERLKYQAERGNEQLKGLDLISQDGVTWEVIMDSELLGISISYKEK